MEDRKVIKMLEQDSGRILVLCDDGTMWTNTSFIPSHGHASWNQVTPVPSNEQVTNIRSQVI